MNVPECANCDDRRKDLCQQLFEGLAAIHEEGIHMLETVGLVHSPTEETLDFMKRAVDEEALSALGILANLGCELTLEEVEQRLLLTK